MMQTSLLAYETIMPSLNERQMMVYALLRQYHDGLTSIEIAGKLGWSINRVTPRVLELRRQEPPLITSNGYKYHGKNPSTIWKV